ncbi:MAG: M48 family metallopeptidase [Patescibacteria group bacterium]
MSRCPMKIRGRYIVWQLSAPKRNRPEYLARKEEARLMIANRLEELNRYYNFKYGRISIRDQRTRWGSCSKKGNLNFNYRLMNLPERVRDYVIVHELCHLKEFNHSSRFWDLVSAALPDYRELRKILKAKIF